MKNLKDYEIELDYLILSNIINSEETEKDIVNMVSRFIHIRNISEFPIPLNIQNPPSETKKEK